MIENISKSGKILVKDKAKKSRSKKGKNLNDKESYKPLTYKTNPDAIREIWEINLEKFLHENYTEELENLIVDPKPYTKDSDDVVNQTRTVLKIQIALHNRNYAFAHKLLKNSRHFWSEEAEKFGSENSSLDEDLKLLEEICLSDLVAVHKKYPNTNLCEIEENREKQQAKSKSNLGELDLNIEAAAEKDSSEDENRGGASSSSDEEVRESEISYQQYLQKFTNRQILQNYIKLLDHFEFNSNKINHYLVKMLYRICHDLKKSGCLYQVCFLRGDF